MKSRAIVLSRLTDPVHDSHGRNVARTSAPRERLTFAGGIPQIASLIGALSCVACVTRTLDRADDLITNCDSADSGWFRSEPVPEVNFGMSVRCVPGQAGVVVSRAIVLSHLN